MKAVWFVALLGSAGAFARDVTLAELIPRCSAIIVATRDRPAYETKADPQTGDERVLARWIVKESLYTHALHLEPGDKLKVDGAEFERRAVLQLADAGVRSESRVYTPSGKPRKKDAEATGEWIVFLVRTGFGFELAAFGAIESIDQRGAIVKEIKKRPPLIP